MSVSIKCGLALGALLVCLTAVNGPAQTPSFEDLVRRAEAALDSRPAEASRLYRQALEKRPDWAEGWLYLGASLYGQDRYAEATDAFRRGIALAPSQGTAWAFLGLCEAELDNPEQALADIRKGEELGLGDNWQFQVAVRVKAAQISIRSAAFEEALGQLQPLALHNEDSRAVVDTMGLCALGVPAVLAELSPQRRAVVNLAGKAAWSLANQHPGEAAPAYRELLERYPNEPGVHYAYGLYVMETDLTAALGEFQKEVQNNPKHWPALILLGSLSTRQGDGEAALQALLQAMKLVPAAQRWICHAELGQAHMLSDHLEAAINEFQTAVRLRPNNAPMHFLLSQAYRRAGRKAEAEREMAEFQKLKVGEDPLGVPGLRPFAVPGAKR
jgi:Flp pilus assembly protein TadD